jgi:PAS domain S-box-containing protein
MDRRAETDSIDDPLAFLAGGGEMGGRIRAFDWSTTPAGPAAGWPQSLKTAVRIMLDARYPMFVWWGPGLTNLYNDAYAPVLGRRHPDALGRPAAEVWADIWHVVGPQADAALNEGRATWSEEQLLLMERNGFLEETYFTYSYSPVPDDRGGIGGVFCACTEETGRVLGRRRLRTLRALSEQANQAKSADGACEAAAATLAEDPNDLPFLRLYLLDDDGRRARLVGLTGVDPDTPAGPAVVDLEQADAPWPFRRVAESGEPVEVVDLPGEPGPPPVGTRPGSPRRAVVLPMAKPGVTQLAGFVVAGISPRLEFNDDYRGFFGLLAGHVGTAVAHARAYQEERRRAEALTELDRAKTAFFSNVSHEFRTPLTLVLGPVEDALADPDGPLLPTHRERLEVVRRNGLRLQKLVNTLLDFSRIEAGRVRAAYEPTDLAAFTADLASNFRSACEMAGLGFRVDCPPLGEPVFVDAGMWEKVVLNLLSNAFKFTLEGEIAVSLRRVGGAAELRVRDTGTGIPPGELPLLFERFHRVEGARGRTHEGSGIGLALVHELVRLHGGTIAAESELGVGTTFLVSIPLGSAHLPPEQVGGDRPLSPATKGAIPFVEEALRWLPEAEGRRETLSESPDGEEDRLPPESEAAQADGDRPRVVVADDNADMRRYTARLLAGRYRTEVVADGEAALAAVRRRPPDLVLCDVMMPRLDGFGLLRALRADPRTAGIPVILLSARAGEESRVEGMAAGADDYLVKPFGSRELLARVSAHIQMARLRREADRTLRESEERFRALVSASSDVVYRMSADWSEMRHLRGRELIADTHAPSRAWLETYIPPEDRRHVLEAIREAIRAKGVFELEHRVVRVDGTPGWTFSRAIPLLGDDGEIVEWFGMASDVTARKEAEEALRRSEERLRLIVESATDYAIFSLDLDGTISTWNSGAMNLLGYEEPEIVGRDGKVLFIPEDVERGVPEEEIRKALERGRAENERWHVRKDGTRFWASGLLMPMRDGGEVVGLLKIMRDTTEQKRTEQELEVSRERLDLVVNSSEVGLWYCDLPFDRLVWNAKCKEHFGLPPDADVTIDTFYGRVHPDDREGVRRAIEQSIGGRSEYDAEFRTLDPQGRVRWVRAIGQPFYDEEGTPLRFDGITVDVTQRIAQEEALREADRRKDEFLATLAHELRNPLAPIRNALHLMREPTSDGEGFEAERAMAERQVVHLARLVDDLMDVARISKGKLELRKEMLDLATVVGRAVESARTAIDERGHRLIVDRPEGPVRLEGDPTRLEQVLWNLLNNAAKYTEPGGEIRLTVEPGEGDVAVRVRDTGIGIEPAMLPSLFQMFVQVGEHRQHAQGGLGIGLGLVRTLVEMHGGSITAHSTGPGEGSEFVLRLPVLRSPHHPAAGPARDEKRTPRAGPPRRRILVVDDNADAANSLARLLTRLHGQEVRVAHDGPSALDVAREFRPEVALLDIGLPGMDGYELARRLRGMPESEVMMLMALTGWGQEADLRKSREAGFDRHLVKPVDPETLLEMLAGPGPGASPARDG